MKTRTETPRRTTEPRDIPLGPLLSKRGREALDAVRTVIDPLWKPGNEEDWRPPEADRRLTWALTKKIDEFVVSVMAEADDSWATRQAKELEKEFPEAVVWTTTGLAQSGYPNHPACHPVLILSNALPHRH